MKTKYCIHCGKVIPARAKYCKYCGARQLRHQAQNNNNNNIHHNNVLPAHLPQKKPLNKNWKIGIAIFIVLLVLFLIPML